MTDQAHVTGRQLNGREFRVLVMTVGEGCSSAEVAEALAIPIEEVERVLDGAFRDQDLSSTTELIERTSSSLEARTRGDRSSIRVVAADAERDERRQRDLLRKALYDLEAVERSSRRSALALRAHAASLNAGDFLVAADESVALLVLADDIANLVELTLRHQRRTPGVRA